MQTPKHEDDHGLDEERPCNVCFSKMAETENEMVFCDGCDVCVHQACYGILKIPEGEWFCDRCAVKAKQEPCVLCPVYEGAMKRTEQGRWCHCSCAWWIPEVHFKDTIAMRPVMGVPDVPKNRFSLKCIFCETNNGACIQCAHAKCQKSFHVTCAFATKEAPDGATFLMFEEPDTPDDLVRKAFCPKHRQEQMIVRAKVKGQLTGTTTQSSNSMVSRKRTPSTKKSVKGTSHHKSKALPKLDSTKSRTSLPNTPTTANNGKSKFTNGSSPLAESKRPRRDTPSIYADNSMYAGDEDGHDSPKRARKSSNNQATVEEIRVLKEFKHASVDTQDHPCTSLLPPLMRWAKDSSSSTSLFHSATLSRGSIFSSPDGSFE